MVSCVENGNKPRKHCGRTWRLRVDTRDNRSKPGRYKIISSCQAVTKHVNSCVAGKQNFPLRLSYRDAMPLDWFNSYPSKALRSAAACVRMRWWHWKCEWRSSRIYLTEWRSALYITSIVGGADITGHNGYSPNHCSRVSSRHWNGGSPFLRAL